MTELKPRSAWTSSAPGGADYDPDKYRGLAIHWPASAGSYAGVTDAQAIATLNGWRKYHMEGHGWSDIAYQYAVTDDGTIWTCRGMGHMSAANGDTGPNMAFGAVILFLGPTDPVTPAMTEAVRWIRAEYMKAGTGDEVLTHNAVKRLFGLPGTECPGPAATAAVARGDFSHPPQGTEGDWFDMATKEELAEVVAAQVAAQLNRGTGAGQVDWASTNKSILSTVQGNHNGIVSVGAAVGAVDLELDSVSVALADLTAIVQAALEGIDLPPEVTVDEIAKAVNDEAARRLAA